MISCTDWRHVSPDVVSPLYDAECARWFTALGWDYRPACGLVEAARARGRLPGLLARDGRGGVVGWAYFLLHQETLQIGNLVAADDDVVRALLDRILRAPDATRAARWSCFLFPRCHALEEALRARGFAIERHAYLRRPLSGAPVPNRLQACVERAGYIVRDWSAEAFPDVVRLLAAAYEGTPEARCFAPDGRTEQWSVYVHQLVHTPACGRFERGLSLLVETPEREMAGAVIVTGLSDRAAHIAQMAVGGAHRRHGLGEWLVRHACGRAREAGYDAMTLVVADSNERARRLYDRLGFEATAQFVFGDRGVPTRCSAGP